MNKSKFGAIKYQIKVGRRLITEHPEIAEMYEDHTYQELAEKLNVSESYNLAEEDSFKAMGYAISGFSGGFGISSYNGLLDKEKRERIKRKHHGNAIREIRVPRNLEIIAEAGRRGALTRGQTPWVLETENNQSEKQRAYELHREGKSYKEVAKVLNAEYHKGRKIRDENKIKKAMFKYRKKLNSIDY